MAARVAVGGFQHETNTFAPRKAGYEAFRDTGGWPGLTRGPGLFAALAGMNIPLSGFVEAARQADLQLEPLLWAQAVPSAHVTQDAYERICGELLEDIAALEGLDAVYLDLHGAMVAEHCLDGEGELLGRVRALIGQEVLLVASLDLHANISPAMVSAADALIAYRTYPHVDMARTGARAARHLRRLLDGEPWSARAFRRLPFLIPLAAGCTLHEPALGLYETLARLEVETGTLLSLACGFAPADVPDCGPSIVGYGAREEAVTVAVESLCLYACDREADFGVRIWSPAEAVKRAKDRAREAGRPVILADTQDNPGAGGEGDTVGLLAELVAQRAEGAALAILVDPEAAAAAHAVGHGAGLEIGLGAKSGMPGHRPFRAHYRVEALGDGRFTGSGPFYRGARMDLGPMALLSVGGVRVVVASRKLQAADQAIFRHLGVEPAEQQILALKSSVHFRADFAPIAEEILVVAAPGPNPVDHLALPYRHLRPGLRLMPLGPAFGEAAASVG